MTKEELDKYEKLYEDTVDYFRTVELTLKELEAERNDGFDAMVELGKDQNKLHSRFIDLDRKVNRLAQDAERLTKIYDVIQAANGERQRKGERSLEKQTVLIEELKQRVNDLTQDNQRLLKEYNDRLAKLNLFNEKNGNIEMDSVDPALSTCIENFMEVNKERRTFQNESEDLPPDWDKRFKKFIQDQSTNVKTAMTEYPSNKQFPGVLEEWTAVMTELNSADNGLRSDQRKQLAQRERLQILNSVQKDVIDINSKLKDKDVKFNESLYADKIKEKREIVKQQQIEAQTLVTELKTLQISSLDYDRLLKLDWDNIKKTEEWEYYTKLISRVRQTRITLGETERNNDNKLNCLKNKDDYIKRLKEEISNKVGI